MRKALSLFEHKELLRLEQQAEARLQEKYLEIIIQNLEANNFIKAYKNLLKIQEANKKKLIEYAKPRRKK